MLFLFYDSLFTVDNVNTLAERGDAAALDDTTLHVVDGFEGLSLEGQTRSLYPCDISIISIKYGKHSSTANIGGGQFVQIATERFEFCPFYS